MLDMVALMVKVPHAMALQSLELTQMIMVYSLAVVVCSILWFRNKAKAAKITDEISEEV